MSEISEAGGDPRICDHLDGLREALGDPRDYAWPPEYLEAFGAGEQPAFVDRDFPECAHPECNEDFWEDGHDDLYDQSTVNYVVSLLDDAIERARQSHPANGRHEHEYSELGLHRPARIGWFLHHRRDGALRRKISILRRNVASPGLSWGSESVSSVDAGQSGASSLPLGSGEHGEPVERVADSADVRPVT